MSTGDDELFDNTRSRLNAEEMTLLATCLRDMTFSFYWNQSSIAQEDILGLCSFNEMTQRVTFLLQQLHSRE